MFHLHRIDIFILRVTFSIDIHSAHLIGSLTVLHVLFIAALLVKQNQKLERKKKRSDFIYPTTSGGGDARRLGVEELFGSLLFPSPPKELPRLPSCGSRASFSFATDFHACVCYSTGSTGTTQSILPCLCLYLVQMQLNG